MHRFSVVPPARFGAVLAVLTGLVAGVATVGLAGGATGRQAPGQTSAQLEATHAPPLLTLPGEDIHLTFDAFCVGAGVEDTSDEGGCDVTGSVFARPGTNGPFMELRLARPDAGAPGQLELDVPEPLASSRSGFSYYAVLRTASGEASTTVPAGGAAAPLVSLPLERPIHVDLGRHVFGRTLQADDRVASAPWGAGPLEAGLEPGRRATPIGASAFDVDQSGAVYLLDETQHRVLQWKKGGRVPAQIPVSVAGTLADMAVAHDGTIYVLETVGRRGAMPLVRRFDGDGRELEAVEIAERTASQIRSAPGGPFVLQQPSNQWMPTMVDGVPADAATQRRGARAGRPLGAGGEVTVLRRGNEIRVAHVGPHGARRGWDIRSDTDVAEIQLAEPVGDRLLLVARVYSEMRDEFVALLLDDRGLVRSFSMQPADWAESAPLGKFRVAGSSLFRLGSTSTGAFVDRFGLEVRR